jgi:toxin YoeB
MRLVFTPNGWEDYTFWLSTDRATLKRINRVLDDIARDPFAGIGKPEQLRHALAGGGRDASMRNTDSSTSSRATTL